MPVDLDRAFSPEKSGPAAAVRSALLSQVLDELVDVGELPAERRPGAEVLAWSAVHGLAMLVLEGPLRTLDADTRTAAGRRVVEMVVRGL